MIYLHKQRGLTLVEVMISITLGLVFLVAAMTFLVGGQQSHHAQDTSSRIQENARFAMDIMRGYVRMAGYSDDLTIAPAYIYRGACGTTINGESSATHCSADTTTAQGDRLAVSQVSPDADAGDCLGTGLGGDPHVANVFWVEQESVTGIPSLYCQGWNIKEGEWYSTKQPLVGGIEQMQVQYGVAATDSVNRYYNAAGVEALANGWANVRSVRISLLVSSGAAASGTTVENNAAHYDVFTLLDGAAYDPPNDRIRKVFSSTVTINNAL